jgi:DNA-directed RNA polymerase specialized sigma24 family protein
VFQRTSKTEARPTFEEVFFEHRIRLCEWAQQLTARNYAEAEDLVQELYIRFARVGLVPEHIENPEHYLFIALRNLYYKLAQRARTSAIDDLSIVDYDSVERSLRAVDRNGIVFIREDLHRICSFLCARKNTSRAASIFILRYFLGYFPGEVMAVVRTSRGAIDKAISAAHKEARLELTRPGVLQQMGGARNFKPRHARELPDSQSLFLALRGKIFDTCNGECFSHVLLQARYETPEEGFTTAELAHLVSCPACLNRANRILGLPLLEERSPDDTLDRDTPPGPDTPAGGTPAVISSHPKRKSPDAQPIYKRLRRSLEEVKQHRPRRLLIAVDGDIRASQLVTAPLSELRAELRPADRPSFIEVLSKQNVCLAFVLVQTLVPEGGLQQRNEILLSDDRTMTVSVSFTTEAPTIQVVYNDPLIASEEETLEDRAQALCAGTLSSGSHPASTTSWKNAVMNLQRRFLHQTRRIRALNMNPLLASAMLFALCSVLCVLLWTRSGPRISATMILDRAEQSDASSIQTGRSAVIYQKVRIHSVGHTMERAIYRDPQKRRHPRQQSLVPSDRWLKDQLVKAGVNWDEPLAAANYGEWRDRLPVKDDTVTRKGSNLLTLTTSTTADGTVFQESLTVRESDFHPVERTISLRDAGVLEIAELNYDVMPWGVVNQDWFEPLPGQSLVDPLRSHPVAAGIPPRTVSDSELDEAELSTRIVLNQLHAGLLHWRSTCGRERCRSTGSSPSLRRYSTNPARYNKPASTSRSCISGFISTGFRPNSRAS